MNVLKKLSLLESKFNVINVFKYKNTTSWINIKNYIYYKSLNSAVKNPIQNSSNFLSFKGIELFFSSLIFYFSYLFNRKSKDIFFGAGSGLFKFNDSIYDSYLPKEIKNSEIIYMLSADFPENLCKYKTYLKRKKVVIYSFLIAPFKIILTKIFKNLIKLDIDEYLLNEIEKLGINKNELEYIHAKFIVTYWIYKIFLLPLKIKKAYVVSAYTNTELISVLKEKNIEIIEIQHGLIGTTHRGYNYAVKSNILPTPNKVYVYDNFWKQELINAGYYSDEQIKVDGRLKYELIDKNLKIFDFDFFVFTGQGGFFDEIAKFMNDSIEYLKDKNLKLLYIPHPNESEKDLNYLKSQIKNFDNILILDSQSKKYTTEQYIYNCIAHISVYSSCHFDAIFFKNKTFIYDVMSENPIQYFIKNFPKLFIPIKSLKEIYD